MHNECIFSKDRKYRYTLHHIWEESKPMAAFIGLNPSTADENQLDPTLRRIKGFASGWGFGSFTMLNLFAFRATDPRVMKAQFEPIGPDNNKHILDVCSTAGIIIACWGTHGSFLKRSKKVMKLLEENSVIPKYLQMTKAGEPSHPLYLKKDLTPKEFVEKSNAS